MKKHPKAQKLFLTQPRVTVRVAKERVEKKKGQSSAGYVVKGDVAICNNTSTHLCPFDTHTIIGDRRDIKTSIEFLSRHKINILL